MRCAAIDSIIKGKSYRKIADEFNLSLQTISLIKKAISEKSYRSYLERSKTERKKKKYNMSPIPDKPKRRGRIIHSKFGTFQAPF
jgi:transposase